MPQNGSIVQPSSDGVEIAPGAPSAPIADVLVHVQCAYSSLGLLKRAGILYREVPWFARMMPLFARRVVLVSYGDAEDREIAEWLRPAGCPVDVECVANEATLEAGVFQAGVPERVLERVLASGAESVLVYQDQHFGGDVSVQVARALRQRGLRVGLIARAGYHWSWTVARDTAPNDPKAAAAAMLEGELCHAADAVVVTTRRIAETIAWQHRLDPARVHVVPNHIAADVPTPPFDAREPGTALFAGRLDPEKRVDLLIRAMAEVGRQVAGAKLRIFGEGSQGRMLKGLAQELGVACEFYPRVPHRDLLEHMGRCAVYAQLSRFEGHPKTILEALAMGAPTVVTRGPGVDDEINPGVTGVVCSDRVEDVARSIAMLLRDRDMARRMGEAAATDVRSRLSLDLCFQKLEAVCRGAMETAGAHAAHPASVVRWEQAMLASGPDGAALEFASSIGAFVKRLPPERRRMFLDALRARVGSLGELYADRGAARPAPATAPPGAPASRR